MKITLKRNLKINWNDKLLVIPIGQSTEIPEDLYEYIKKNYPGSIDQVDQANKKEIPIVKKSVFQNQARDLFEMFFEPVITAKPTVDPMITKGLELGVIQAVPEGYQFEGKQVQSLDQLDIQDVKKTIEIVSF